MNESDTSLANKTGHFNLLTTEILCEPVIGRKTSSCGRSLCNGRTRERKLTEQEPKLLGKKDSQLESKAPIAPRSA
jgi:hypothetical protein